MKMAIATIVISFLLVTIVVVIDDYTAKNGIQSHVVIAESMLPVVDVSMPEPLPVVYIENTDKKIALNHHKIIEGLRLSAIFEDVDNPNVSIAVIDTGKESILAKVGSTIKRDVTLAEIKRSYVMLKYKGKLFRLNISSLASKADNSVGTQYRGSSVASNSSMVGDYQQSFMSSPNSNYVKRIYEPSTIDHASYAGYEFRDQEDENKTNFQSESSGVIGLSTPVNSTTSLTTETASGSDTTANTTIVADGGSRGGLPEFMKVANIDAYVPVFMQAGGLEVSSNQIPGYMN